MGATPTDLRITDIVPIDDSGESDQNSEPSLAVDPLDPTQMIAGAFADGSPQPFYKSTDGGTTWSDYGTIVLTDKSIAWLTDGSAALTATVFGSANIKIHSGTTADTHFSPPTTQPTPDEADQPWIVTGPADHVYVGYNDDSTTAAFTASALVSTDGGVSFSNVVLDRANPLGDQPSIRLAVNGSTAYAVFVRENSLLDNPYSGPNGKDFRYNSSFVIVRSDDGGADGFTALGANGNGVTIASPISVFAEDPDSPLTLGQNAAGAEIAIAVDPNNTAHVVVAYGDATGAGNSTPSDLQLVVAESTDGGADWTTKFISSSLTRSGDPGLAILQDGEIGLLYDNYDPATDELSQHLLTTTDDFATTHDLVLGTETNKTPGNVFEPYLGDFFNLTSIGDTFYGVFSASNQDDGIHGQLNGATTFQRDYNGTPDTATFQLTDLSGSPVGASIDPFFFELQAGSTAPFDVDGDTVSDLVFQNNGTPQIWLWNGTAVTSQTTFSDPGPSWRIVTSADVNGDGNADLIWQNSDGTPGIWLMNGLTPIAEAGLTNPGTSWHLVAAGDVNGDGNADLIWQEDGGTLGVWEMNGTTPIAEAAIGNPGANWKVVGSADFNGDGRDDILLQNSVTGNLMIDLMNGTSVASSVSIAVGDPSWHAVSVGAFNGQVEIAWQSNNGTPGLWLMNGTNPSAEVGLPNPGSGWQLVSIDHFTPNGQADLLFQNSTNSAMMLWEMNGTSVAATLNLPNPGAGWQSVNGHSFATG